MFNLCSCDSLRMNLCGVPGPTHAVPMCYLQMIQLWLDFYLEVSLQCILEEQEGVNCMTFSIYPAFQLLFKSMNLFNSG